MADQEKANMLMQFLMGLHPDFDHLRYQILLVEPLPSLDKVYSMIYKIKKKNEVSNIRYIEIANASLKSVEIANVAAQFASSRRHIGNDV